MKIDSNRSIGFTLIELLVVISVIGMLAAIILVSLNSARAKARDARRIADVQQIYKALELYYLNNGSVPSCSNGGYAGGCDFVNPAFVGAADSTQDGQFLPFLSSYTSNAIRDPLNRSPHYYIYAATNVQFPAGSGIRYVFLIAAILETRVPDNGIPSIPGYEQAYILGHLN